MAKKDRTDKNLYDRADWWMDSEDDPHVILDSVVKKPA